MSSLIMVVMAIVLSSLLGLATLSYMGSAFTSQSARIAASALESSFATIASATSSATYNKEAYTSVAQLQTLGYLDDIPLPFKEGYSSGIPVASDWEYLSSNSKKSIILYQKLNQETCEALNYLSTNSRSIPSRIGGNFQLICFGPSAPYSAIWLEDPFTLEQEANAYRVRTGRNINPLL